MFQTFEPLLKSAFVATAFLTLTSVHHAQTTEPWLGLVAETEHTEGELAGMTTYRLYVYTTSPDDFLVLCGGWDDNPMTLESTASPAWFQSPYANNALATSVLPGLYETFPELEFDSWLTVGAEPGSAMQITTLADTGILVADTLYEVDPVSQDTLGFTVDTTLYVPPYDMFADFQAGNSVVSDGPIGNAWFVLPQTSNLEAFAGDDERILIAQLTTSGEISGEIFVSLRMNFIAPGTFGDFEAMLPILVACNDPEALNYEPQSQSADGCEYGEVQSIAEEVQDVHVVVFPAPATDGATVSFPAHLASSLAGAELRATALDGRLVQSWPIEGVTQHLDLTDLAAGQYVLTVAGVSDATLRFRGDLVVVK